MEELYEFPVFLTTQDVSRILRISLSAACHLCREPSFPAVKIGSRYRVPRSEFIRWIQERLPDRTPPLFSTDVRSIYALEKRGSKENE